MFLTATSIQYLLRPPAREFRTSIHRILLLLHCVLLYRNTRNLATTVTVTVRCKSLSLTRHCPCPHPCNLCMILLRIFFESSLLPSSSSWTTQYMNCGMSRGSTLSQDRLPCVWRWFVSSVRVVCGGAACLFCVSVACSLPGMLYSIQ